MKILITGATGFVGSHLLPFLSTSHQVIAVSRQSEKRVAGDQIQVDLAKPIQTHVLPRVEALIHLAQADHKQASRDEIFQVNAESTKQLLDHAIEAGARLFILASTGNVYKPSPEPLRESDPTTESDAYSESKLLAETYALERSQKISVIILRLFTPYGPGQSGRMIPGIAERVRRGQPIVLRNGGQPAVTPIYIDDLCAIIQEALSLSGTHVVNIAGEEVANIRQLATMCGDILDQTPSFLEEQTEKDWNLIADTTRMRNLFTPRKYVSLKSGLTETLR